ncbi:YueI family protein [Halalkalibacter oceani]|uniref:YueI family protein n=1 Tax=Halalkalibacter oceani TaxID=1653776 RepID=UPI00339849B3
MEQKMKEVIDRALYGAPEIKPEERNLFLSTLLERIHLALTKKQVINKGMYKEAVELMKTKRNLHLYLNGNLGYNHFSNYIKEAGAHGVSFTFVTPKKLTPFGLIVANQTEAIETKQLFIKDELFELDMEESGADFLS